MRLAFSVVEALQFSQRPGIVELLADGRLLEMESTVAAADLGDQIDVAESIGVLSGVSGEALRFSKGVGLRIADRRRPEEPVSDKSLSRR